MNLEFITDKFCQKAHVTVVCDIYRGLWMFQKIYKKKKVEDFYKTGGFA